MSDALEQASLIMVPSGYENGTLGSLKPLDGSGDFTFTRGSDISATRVNEDGYIDKGYENLLPYSNDFSQWTTNGIDETSGQEGYDGTNDAWLIEKTNVSTRVEKGISYTGVSTFSVYAKAGTLNWIQLNASNVAKYYDLENGVLGSTSGTPSMRIDFQIESVGNGWYRCSITTNQTIGIVRIYPANGNQDTSGTSGSVYIQDAMVNQGLVAYPYLETTTAPVAGGILEDEPRLDYSGSCPALLLEPQRTNLINSSEYFNDYFTKSRLSVSTNVTTAPDGLTTASKLIEDSNPVYHSISQGFGDVGSHTTSVYAKAAERSHIMLWNGGVSSGQIFNLDSGTKGSILGAAPLDSSIEDAGNGWYRCIMYNNSVSSAGVYICINDTTASYQGDGASGVYIYGFQVEEDATYPTSYIPTYGTSQTRSSEGINIPSSADLSVPSDSWTILWDLSDESVAVAVRWWTDSENNINLYPASPNKSRVYWRGIGQYITSGGGSKIIARFDGTTATEFHDGVNRGSASYNGQLPFNFNTDMFLANGKYILNKFIIFPTALSDDECIALTTIS